MTVVTESNGLIVKLALNPAAAGLSASLTINPLDSVTTVTVQIVSLLTGDTEFDDIKTLSAFGLGLALFFFTLLLNIFALSISRRLAERYD